MYDEPRRADAADPTAAATSASPAAFDAADKRYPTATRLASPAEITIASVGRNAVRYVRTPAPVWAAQQPSCSVTR